MKDKVADREQLIELINQKVDAFFKTEELADYLLENDVTKVIRCKDCKHFIPDEMLDHTEHPNEIEADGVCDNIDKYTDKDHFCWYGELKELNNNA